MKTLKLGAFLASFFVLTVFGFGFVNAASNAPTVSSVGPSSATVGTTVYVYGTNFDKNTFVALDGNYGQEIQPNAITVMSPTELTFVVPSSVNVGAHSLAVNEVAGSFPLSSSVTLNVVAAPQAPTVSSVGPSSATVGTTVYVYGTNFDKNTFVALDGNYGQEIQPNAITVMSPTELTFVVPSSVNVGAHSLAVNEVAGSFPLSSSVTLNVVAAPQAPTVSSVGPSSATVGTTVYVYGTNFDKNTFVALDGNYGQEIQPNAITVMSPTELTFVVPSSVNVGAHSLAVNEVAGSFPLSSSVTLNVVAAPQAPTVSSVGPSSATVGTTVYVYGTNFDKNTFVALDGNYGQEIQPNAITVMSPTELTFVVPSSVNVGAHSLAVNEVAGSFPLSSSVTLNVVAAPQAPTVSSAGPSSATVGTTVYVYGTNFDKNTFVALDGNYGQEIQPNAITVMSPTELTFVVPSSVNVGAHSLAVNEVAGSFPLSSSVTLNVVAAPQAPTVSSVGPSSATVGTTVYVYGTNFDKNTFVALDGNYGQEIQPNAITVMSPTELTFVVPSSVNVGAHSLAVNEVAGSFPLSSSVTLNVVAAPQAPTTNATSSQGTANTPSTQALQAQLVQLISLLLQLLQQAAKQGLLTSGELSAALNTISH